VGAFLRFLAANSLTANVESFFALGQNYHLYLDAKTNKFAFLPGDLEFSLANFLLMGSGNELSDLSLVKPYPGENKLPDRLLAIPAVKQRYDKLVQELAATVFTKDKLLEQIKAIDAATREIKDQEAKAVLARREPPAGFGGPGGPAPQPPSLQSFAEKRTASIASQLAGTSKGYVPRPFSFGPPAGAGAGGPPGRTGPDKPIDEATFRANVQTPPELRPHCSLLRRNSATPSPSRPLLRAMSMLPSMSKARSAARLAAARSCYSPIAIPTALPTQSASSPRSCIRAASATAPAWCGSCIRRI
jgi:hypothetical protein